MGIDPIVGNQGHLGDGISIKRIKVLTQYSRYTLILWRNDSTFSVLLLITVVTSARDSCHNFTGCLSLLCEIKGTGPILQLGRTIVIKTTNNIITAQYEYITPII